MICCEVDSAATFEMLLLLERGADPNLTNSAGGSPLMDALWHGWEKGAKALLDHGAKIDAVAKDGETALHAAAKGSWPLVRRLLDAGANPKAAMTNGMTPMHATVTEGLISNGTIRHGSRFFSTPEANGPIRSLAAAYRRRFPGGMPNRPSSPPRNQKPAS
jgi:ankyrin repeat protein